MTDVPTPEEGVNDHVDGKGCLKIAQSLFDAGGGTVEELTEAWELDDQEREELLTWVREGFKDGRWADRRRSPIYSKRRFDD